MNRLPEDKTTIFVASAGTGKTTALIKQLSIALKEVSPSQICYTTFSRAAAEEAKSRVCSEFSLDSKAFRYFGTLHALCYQNIPSRTMMTKEDYMAFGKHIKCPVYGYSTFNDDGSPKAATKGDFMLSLYNKCRVTFQKPNEVLQTVYSTQKIALLELEYFISSYDQFKVARKKIDFSDQLWLFYQQGNALPIKYLFIDEAQDLSELQWSILNLLAVPCNQVFVAGDDKQCIYEFAGASPDALVEQKGKRIVLDRTYRCAKAVLDKSLELTNKIKKKSSFSCVSFREEKGSVRTVPDITDLPLTTGSWFFLVRNRFLFPVISELLTNRGVLFSIADKNSEISDSLITAITDWKLLLEGESISAKKAKNIYTFISSHRTNHIAYGFKTVIQNLDDNHLVDYATLKQDFGLRCSLSWDKCFMLREATKIYLSSVFKKGIPEYSIEVNTIHGVKGREADNVVLFTDIAPQVQETLSKNPDAEHRVFYVGITRARNNLYIHKPLTDTFYNL